MMINAKTSSEPLNGVQGAKAKSKETPEEGNDFLAVLDQMLGTAPEAVTAENKKANAKTDEASSARQTLSPAAETDTPSEPKTQETLNQAAVPLLLLTVPWQATTAFNPYNQWMSGSDSPPGAALESSGIAAVNGSAARTKTDNPLAEFSTSKGTGAIAASVFTLSNAEEASAVTGEAAVKEDILQTSLTLDGKDGKDGKQEIKTLLQAGQSGKPFNETLSEVAGTTKEASALNQSLSQEGGPASSSNVKPGDTVQIFKMTQGDSATQNSHADLGKGANQTASGVHQDTAPASDSRTCQVEKSDGAIGSRAQETAVNLKDKAETENAIYKKESPEGMQQESVSFLHNQGRTVINSPKANETVQKGDDLAVFSQVSQQVTQVLNGKESASFKMKLHPEGLGEISVTLTCQDDKVTLAIVTENLATQKLLESQTGQLKAALLAKNYEVFSLSVSASQESYPGTENPFSSEGRYSGFNGDGGFTFTEGSLGKGQNGQGQKQPDYLLTNDLLKGQETTEYRKWQGFYTGQLNDWA